MLPDTINGYVEYMAQAGDMFDLIALRMYGDDKLAGYIIEYNPEYSDVLIFEGGELLKLPIVEDPETEETVAPWKR
ncbi:MAG: LysM domain-containing protein [Butyrivibrio sp.]|nr:LysM domain-containing protein [Butyrivibrio sp.]